MDVRCSPDCVGSHQASISNISPTTMASSKPSSELPLELVCEIIKFLPLTDLQTISLASRLIRSQAIHFIFGHLRYTRDIPLQIRKIHQVRNDVKAVIKKLELFSHHVSIENNNERLVVFQFLKTLPNLQVLDIGALFLPAYLSELISSIRHTSLLELVHFTDWRSVEGRPTAGLAGLEKLSIVWCAQDILGKPGSSLTHLYEFIWPTLTTLVELELAFEFGPHMDLDLQLLKPAADSLRSFKYTLRSTDESVFDTIPAILPHLQKLSIKWKYPYRMYCIPWKDAHIQSLSKNINLTDLELSSDFEVNARDTLRPGIDDDYARFVRSYKRRFKATQDVTSACPRLQRCSWFQMGTTKSYVQKGTSRYEMSHPFIIEERMTGGNVIRVVRGIQQDWMGRDHDTEEGIVKCKLEDLPGDIIGRNDDIE